MPTVSAISKLDAFRESMARFAASVHIVTSQSGGRRHGMTMTAACSLAVDPMSLILSVNRKAAAHEPTLPSRQLCLNMLAPGHDHLAIRFAGGLGHNGEERFAHGDWQCEMGTDPHCFAS